MLTCFYMCSSNARHQKEDLRRRLPARVEYLDVAASIGKYTCLTSAVRAPLTLDVVAFASKARIYSYLCCATKAITAGQGSTLWPRTEPPATDIDFKRIP